MTVEVSEQIGPAQQRDAHLARWSLALMAMVLIAAALNISFPIYEFFYGLTGFVKDEGKTVWTSLISALPLIDRFAITLFTELDSVVWLYVLLQIWLLARYYRSGRIFEECNAVCFMKVGQGLCIMGIVQSFEYHAVNHYLFWRGISPWLGDTPPVLFAVRVDMLMAGLFFFVLGKIMRRAIELEETNRLIV
jgi:hypothetical protein